MTQQDQRAAFEAWFKGRHNLHPDTDLVNRSDAFEPYKAWQASIAHDRQQQKDKLPTPPHNDIVCELWVTASDVDGIVYDGPSFERGYLLGMEDDRQQRGELVAWMTHHDEPMLFASHKEAAAYCDEDEAPIPLYTAPQPAESKVASSMQPSLQPVEPIGYIAPAAVNRLRQGGFASLCPTSVDGGFPVYLAPQPSHPEIPDSCDAQDAARWRKAKTLPRSWWRDAFTRAQDGGPSIEQQLDAYVPRKLP